MLLASPALQDLAGTVALMALLSVAYGAVIRTDPQRWLGRSVLGALFGLAAILAMNDPVVVAPGVIVDLRTLPVALAGAFLGFEGAAVAAGLALAMRAGIGGAGMQAGCVSILAAASLGLLWARLTGAAPRRSAVAILGLALLTAVPWGSFVLPAGMRGRFVLAVWPVLVPLHALGALGVGLLLERERVLVAEARRLARAAERDPLTGLLNRRGFEAAVAEAMRPTEEGRERGGAALLVIDLDHFKRVNDTHGHAAGDAVLGAIGPRLRGALRAGDVMGRMGGEEIAVYLPAIGPTGAEDAAQRLCAVVRNARFALPDGGALPVTVSIGGAWTGGRVQLDLLLDRADAALYAAKRAGRDRCRFAAAVAAEGGPGGRPAARPRVLIGPLPPAPASCAPAPGELGRERAA